MNSETELDLKTALGIVIGGCQNHYDHVYGVGGVHPLYREALPIVRAHLAAISQIENYSTSHARHLKPGEVHTADGFVMDDERYPR